MSQEISVIAQEHTLAIQDHITSFVINSVTGEQVSLIGDNRKKAFEVFFKDEAKKKLNDLILQKIPESEKFLINVIGNRIILYNHEYNFAGIYGITSNDDTEFPAKAQPINNVRSLVAFCDRSDFICPFLFLVPLEHFTVWYETIEDRLKNDLGHKSVTNNMKIRIAKFIAGVASLSFLECLDQDQAHSFYDKLNDSSNTKKAFQKIIEEDILPFEVRLNATVVSFNNFRMAHISLIDTSFYLRYKHLFSKHPENSHAFIDSFKSIVETMLISFSQSWFVPSEVIFNYIATASMAIASFKNLSESNNQNFAGMVKKTANDLMQWLRHVTIHQTDEDENMRDFDTESEEINFKGCFPIKADENGIFLYKKNSSINFNIVEVQWRVWILVHLTKLDVFKKLHIQSKTHPEALNQLISDVFKLINDWDPTDCHEFLKFSSGSIEHDKVSFVTLAKNRTYSMNFDIIKTILHDFVNNHLNDFDTLIKFVTNEMASGSLNQTLTIENFMIKLFFYGRLMPSDIYKRMAEKSDFVLQTMQWFENNPPSDKNFENLEEEWTNRSFIPLVYSVPQSIGNGSINNEIVPY